MLTIEQSYMWEELEIYKQLDKKDINPTFKKFGISLSHLTGYSITQTNSLIKLSRQVNQLEQAIFIERDKGGYQMEVRTSIKPVDFYRKHKFTMLNIVTLGEIMNSYRKTSYPLTQEWEELAIFLSSKIKLELEQYFRTFDSYEKIIANRKLIEPKDFDLDNKYELLIYAAIKTRNLALLEIYIDKKLERTTMRITQSEFLKSNSREIDEKEFLRRVKFFAKSGDFESIQQEIDSIK